MKSTPAIFSERGFSVVAWLMTIPAILILLLVIAVIIYEGRKAYWDAQVKEMCAKDGGVKVHEVVELSEEEYKQLGGGRDGLPLPSASNEKSGHPYFYELIDSNIRESSPAVMRAEMLVVRRSDKKVLGRSIQYFRRGGDLPTGLAEGSSFICPENLRLINQIFQLKGAFK